MRSLWLSLCVLLFTLAPLAGTAQEEPPSLFGEMIDVRAVNVEVVVTDRDGNRVTDLKPGDFRLKVNGREVPIDFFTEVRDGEAAPPVPAAEAQVQGAPPAEPEPRPTPGRRVGTSYLVFVDDFFPLAIHRNEVLAALKQDLGELRPEDRMAVVAYDGLRLTLLSNWTGSREELERTFEQAAARPARGPHRLAEVRSLLDAGRYQEQTDIASMVSPASQGSGLAGPSMLQVAAMRLLSAQVEGEIQAATAALRSFAAPPGRKVMLLLSGGWPFSVQSYLGLPITSSSRQVPETEQLFRPLTNTANLLGYTLYPVDVPGFMARAQDISADPDSRPDPTLKGGPTPARASFEGRQGSFIAPNMPPPQDSAFMLGSLKEQEVQGTLDFLAGETGGRALMNSRRLTTLPAVAADVRSYYWLGFTPDWQGNDKRHRVQVEVRRAGYKVRSRESFLDLSKKAETTMQLESTLLTGSFPDSVPLPVQLGEMKSSRRGNAFPVTLAIPASALTLVQVDGKYQGEVEVRFVAADGLGNRTDIPVIPLRLAGNTLPAGDGFVRYSTNVTLPKGANLKHLLVAVTDPVSGRTAVGEAEIGTP